MSRLKTMVLPLIKLDNHYIYCITNLVNGKKYIGKRTCHCDIEKDTYMGSGIAIKKALKKYGKDSFKKDIIEVCNNEEEAYIREREIIESVKAYSNKMYYNIAFGGLGNTHNWKPTKESIKKSLETKRKNGTLPIGKNNGMFGKYNYSKCSEIVAIPRKGNIMYFPSLAEASRKLKIPYSTIHIRLKRGSTKMQNDFFFMYRDNFEKIDDKPNFVLEKQKSIKKNAKKRDEQYQFYNGKMIYRINVETLDVISEYPNIHTAAKELNIKSTMIRRNVLHNANCASKGYSFIFAEEYKTIKRIDLYKLYHKKEYEGQHKPRPEQRRPIYCLTTNQKFDTADDAIKYFGLTKGTKIQSVCKGERQYAGKHPVNGEPLVYQYYDDYIKGIYRFYIPKNPKYRNERVDKIVSLYKERFAAKKF